MSTLAIRMRPAEAKQQTRQAQQGQVVVLFSLFLVVLLLAAALVLDVARAYALQRFERSVADAAALAGAQDLQILGTRTPPTSTEQANARADALRVVINELGGSAALSTQLATCGGYVVDSFGNFANYPITGTQYVASITTPYSGALTVATDRAVKVALAQPSWSLTFARVPPFNGTTWNVGAASVGGLTFEGQYAVITLRPPDGTDTGSALGDVTVGGDTHISIANGDIGTNRSMTFSAVSSQVTLQPDFAVYHYDTPAPWGASPPNHPIFNLINDPNYTIPVATGAPHTYFSLGAALDTSANCLAIVTTYLVPDPGYKSYVPGYPDAPDMTHINCYQPGVYNVELKDGAGDLSILEPGLYFFNQGVTLKNSLIGGYQAGHYNSLGQPIDHTGVALVFPHDMRVGQFKNNNTGVVSLNAGTRFGNPLGGTEATPALDYSGNAIVANNTLKLMTVIVQKDPNCEVVQPYPSACDDTHNKVIGLNGGSALYLAGVQYAPTDNAAVAGNTVSGGYVGQIVSWTVSYSGNASMGLQYPGNAANGVVRLDTACSPGVACP